MSELSTSVEPAPVSGRSRGRSTGRVGDVVWVLVAFLVLGIVAGLLWWAVVTPPYYVRNAQGAVMAQQQLGLRVQADGRFLTIGFVAALVAGVALVRWRRDPLVVLLVGVVASVAAGYLALRLGLALGHRDVPALVRAAKVGGHVTDSLGVISRTVVLAWPVGWLVGALAVLLGTRDRVPESHAETDQNAPFPR